MKKFYFLVLAILLSGGSFAQNPMQVPIKKEVLNMDAPALKKHFNNKSGTKSLESRWYNYAFAVDEVMNTAEINANTLWPDTTIWVTYISGNVSSPWIHSMTTIIDPVSTWFNDYGTPSLKIYPFMPYTIDSIGYYFLYYRNYADTSVVDTLTFDVFTRNAGIDQKYYIASHPGYPNIDTVWFLGVDFDAATGALDFQSTSYTVLLDKSSLADTTDDGLNYLEFPVTGFGQISPGDEVGVRVRFKPGHPYTPFVDSTSQVNYIRLLSYEELGDNTYPNYIPGDWNVSSAGRSDSWFDPGASWYELEVSTFGFVASYPLENHLINFLLSADYNIGIDMTEPVMVKLYPNPANNCINIDLLFDKHAQFEIISIFGEIVKKGYISQARNIIDISNLPPGMYLINIKNNQLVFSEKIVIK